MVVQIWLTTPDDLGAFELTTLDDPEGIYERRFDVETKWDSRVFTSLLSFVPPEVAS